MRCYQAEVVNPDEETVKILMKLMDLWAACFRTTKQLSKSSRNSEDRLKQVICTNRRKCFEEICRWQTLWKRVQGCYEVAVGKHDN